MAALTWRNTVYLKLQERNNSEREQYRTVIESHCKLYDITENLKKKTATLTDDINRLRQENLELQRNVIEGGGRSDKQLEQKLLKAHEELKDLYKKRGENAQALIDLKEELQIKEKDILSKDLRISELESRLNAVKLANEHLESDIAEKETTNTILKDELMGLQMAYTKAEEKIMKLDKENKTLIDRWMNLKKEAAEDLNKENEMFRKRKQEKLKKDIQDAISNPVEIKEGSIHAPSGLFAGALSRIPSRAIAKFDAHDSEVFGLKWAPSGKYFATVGGDKQVKTWEKIGSSIEKKALFTPCFNRSVTSVDFDEDEKCLIASSNDCSTQIWDLSTRQLRVRLTGHENKVHSSKFVSGHGINKVVSGSQDKTIRLWDVANKLCSRTFCPGSTCFDLVAYGENIISGHFDGKIRIWDSQAQDSMTNIPLENKTKLLTCSRDHCLKITDFRQNRVIITLHDDNFRISNDCSRAVFSPDEKYVLAGSNNGQIIIWNIAKQSVEYRSEKEHKGAIQACSWNPNGDGIISCDLKRGCILWGDF
ncbi:DgyrCDS6998 [Dimorphilus gyrociliatus]|uniref:DgyrCDS6998 n=1 Tax=Dimorphilus gyrociliatus TaxID=2664684 RepID=A0A7I8VPX5_9ANNE|nr:DgyrCDS6998 [Dimorphilus gyrociliatus]